MSKCFVLRNLIAAGLLLLLGAATLGNACLAETRERAASHAAADNQIRQMAREAIRGCGGTGDVQFFAVLPAHPARSLTARQMDFVRREIEASLQRVEHAQIRPVASLNAILHFISGKPDIDAEQISERLDRSRDVDFIVRYTIESHEDVAAHIRLEAVGIAGRTDRRGLCQQSTAIALTLPDDDQAVQISNALAAFAREVEHYRRTDEPISVDRFRRTPPADTECDQPLTDRLISALAEAGSRDPLAAQPSIRLGGANWRNAFKTEPLRIVARFRKVTENARQRPDQAELVLSFRVSRGPDTLFARSAIRVVGIYCSPDPVDFITYLKSGMQQDVASFHVYSDRYRVGDRAQFKVVADTDGALYCWYVNEERTAFVMLPNPRAATSWRIEAKRRYVFPDDFGWPVQRFKQRSHDLFHCFLATKDLSRELHDKWMDLWGNGGSGANGALTEEEIVDVVAGMRTAPGLFEAAADVVVE